MNLLSLNDTLVISRTSFESDDPFEAIQSNIEFINGLFAEYFYLDEISRDALRSYYVDYYLAQINNGGFSQFVYNSRWSAETVQFVREGLQAIGATQHLALFEKGANLVGCLAEERLNDFLNSDYFDTNVERDELDSFNEDFLKIAEDEDLAGLNSAWLKGHPRLVVLSDEDFTQELNRRGELIPNRQERIEKAKANRPRYAKLIDALCDAAGHKLDRITAGDPTHIYRGQQILAWHFLTDRGHFFMVDAAGKAVMFDGKAGTMVHEIDAP